MVGPPSSIRSPSAADGEQTVRAARVDSAPGAGPAGGIPDSQLAGPFPVGDYAGALRAKLRSFARVQLVGELVNLRPSRARVYFELRDAGGALPCAAWRDDWERMVAGGGAPVEGMQVVVAGGCDFYPGSATSSPGFSFAVSELRIAGEGDLLARIDRLRKRLDAEGLCEPQRRLTLPLVPRTIGVVTGERGKARDDVLAALQRRGWAGRVVWAYAPVQDRHAAPAIVRALGDLAGLARVDVVIVARGGGSLADLLCFCDETLCRTVALLDVPVIASVGHHTDRTLLDDVAAVSCSTPTHAAEAAVGIDLRRARHDLAAGGGRLRDHATQAMRSRAELPVAAARLRENGRRALLTRARLLASLSRAPGEHVARQRARLHQQLREIRAASSRRLAGGRELSARHALVLARKADAALLDARERRPRELQRLALALAAHDPQRTLERGYAIVESPDGAPLASAREARAARELLLRFADASVAARVDER
ncbi:MAG TPA: exodeoxyribonuclease VII large subunit [Solirubrobacteraceae bacterium]|jgi:exodeoxyribonuclease VII large subunit